MMKIIENHSIPIDFCSDGILFTMNLFNQGKYDRDQLRTIIRNTGLNLKIKNSMSNPIEVKDIALGICLNNKLVKSYHSSGIQLEMPQLLFQNRDYSVNFYGDEVSNILAQHTGETGIFILYPAQGLPFISSDFNGDNIEKIFTELRDDEMANWGSVDFKRLDITVTHKIK